MLNKKLSFSAYVKRGIQLALFMTIAQQAFAQPLYSKYFLNELSGRNQMNAAFAPEYGYLSLPGFQGIGGSISASSGLSGFIFPLNGRYTTFLNKSVNADDFLSKIGANTSIDQSLNVNVFSFGFFTKRKSFWSFNVAYRENLSVNLPADFFALAKKGMSSSTILYDLKNISLEQNNLGEVALGYSRMIGSKVRFGLNAKLLVGLAASKVHYEKFDVKLDQNQFKVDATGDIVLISDAISFPKDENNNFKFGDYDLNASKLKPAGYGAAVDLGVTYNPIPKLTLSASVNDLGSLKWNSASVKHGVAAGGVEFAGFKDVDAQNVDIQAQLDQMKEDAKGLMQFKETAVTESYKYDLPTIVRVGAEYSLFNNPKHDISLGVLYQSFSSLVKSNQELVGALNLKLLSWVTVSGTCAVLQKEYNRYGVALNFSPSWFNFFIASDFVVPKVSPEYLPIDKFNLNIETGFNLAFGRSSTKLRKPHVVAPRPTQPDLLVVPAKLDTLIMPTPVDTIVAPAKADSMISISLSDLVVAKPDTIVPIAVEVPPVAEVVPFEPPVPVVVTPEVVVVQPAKVVQTKKATAAKTTKIKAKAKPIVKSATKVKVKR
jgi:hypothetical protein